ncbi:hypothetical protein MPSEU_000257400 [Mayamaea pseudoterrestris]|nr:hypothetical protein MPSEU_000257400 [Mayamaea pseudoterrestris]
MSDWSIETWCASQQPSDIGSLDASAQSFLGQLNLDAIHPFCKDTSFYYVEGVPPQGPLLSHEHLETTLDVALTTFFRVCPPLLAMVELWLRLFAFVCAPLGLARLSWEILGEKTSKQDGPRHIRVATLLVALLTLASSVVLTTDDLYRLEFETYYGLNMLILSVILVIRLAVMYRRRLLVIATLGSVALTMYMLFDATQGTFMTLHHALPQFNEGLYYDESNTFAQRVQENWLEATRSYLPPKATVWMPTGDSRTGLPFLLNHVDSPSWTRVWLSISDDDEVVAIDIHFPNGRHDTIQPLFLVLHGLNGGSQEEYVKDFTHRQAMENATVAVMVARGLMDLPVRGMNLFHGARWTDVHVAATALRKGLVEKQLLAGVGYSMGGIILPNYVARSGADCALDVAVSVSGGLDMRYETNFSRAQRLWQPILTQELREKFVVGKWGERTKARLTTQQMKYMMRAYHISEIDETAVVAYNGFRNLDHYVSSFCCFTCSFVVASHLLWHC